MMAVYLLPQAQDNNPTHMRKRFMLTTLKLHYENQRLKRSNKNEQIHSSDLKMLLILEECDRGFGALGTIGGFFFFFFSFSARDIFFFSIFISAVVFLGEIEIET